MYVKSQSSDNPLPTLRFYSTQRYFRYFDGKGKSEGSRLRTETPSRFSRKSLIRSRTPAVLLAMAHNTLGKIMWIVVLSVKRLVMMWLNPESYNTDGTILMIILILLFLSIFYDHSNGDVVYFLFLTVCFKVLVKKESIQRTELGVIISIIMIICLSFFHIFQMAWLQIVMIMPSCLMQQFLPYAENSKELLGLYVIKNA